MRKDHSLIYTTGTVVSVTRISKKEQIFDLHVYTCYRLLLLITDYSLRSDFRRNFLLITVTVTVIRLIKSGIGKK